MFNVQCSMFNKINFPPYKGGAGRVLLALVLLLSSCSLYRKYGDTPEVPSNVMGDVSNQGDTASLGAVSWRQLFTDPQLQNLIEKAWTNNTDVKAAQLSIEQAQNDLTVARLGYLPTLSFEPSGTLNRFNGVGVHSYVIPVKASWQLNIFGQVTSRKRQAKARAQLAADYRQAVMVNLAANIASAYYTLVMYDHELDILRQTLGVWEESLESMRTLYEEGLYQSPAVYRMEASLSAVKSGIVEVEEDIVTTEAVLCRLLSDGPHHIARASFGAFSMPEQINVGIPLQLLKARPDVRQAVRNMEIAYYDTHRVFIPISTSTVSSGGATDREPLILRSSWPRPQHHLRSPSLIKARLGLGIRMPGQNRRRFAYSTCRLCSMPATRCTDTCTIARRQKRKPFTLPTVYAP